MSGGAKLTALLGAVLAFALGVPACAGAANTLVGFDDLSAGTLVTSQYQAQGLLFGTAAGFSQTSPGAGDCGSPTITEETAVTPARSPKRFALLARCAPSVGAPKSSGTYGALTQHPLGSLSVYVRDLGDPAMPTKVAMTMSGYDAGGAVVASGKGEASREGWTHILAAQTGAQAVPIAYFLIRTSGPSEESIGIDDLEYEKAPEEPGGGGGGGGTGGGGSGGGGGAGGGSGGGGSGGSGSGSGSSSGTQGSQPPTPVLTLQSPNPGPGQQITLSGAGSQGGGGQIISYDWDLNGDGHNDTSTGTNPIAHLILAPGAHTIGLTVTNSNGQSSTSRLGLTIPSMVQMAPPADGGQGPCEPTYEQGAVRIIAECIQKESGGGFVIATRQLALNGMVLMPKAGGFGIFKIKTQKDYAIDGTATLLSGPAVNVELLNTPIGDVVIGGRDLTAEPIRLESHSALGQHVLNINHSARVGHGAFASGHRARRHGAHSADDEEKSRTLLMSIGVGHSCAASDKTVGCCPPTSGTTACATLPGSFPLTGQVNVYLNNKGQALFDVQVGLNLSAVNFQATGALEIVADPEIGVELNSLKFTIPEAGLASIFKVKDAAFSYYFPSDPDPSKRDTWQAKGKIIFGPLEQPSLEGELAFQHGQFHSASLVLTLPPGAGVPIYPGIILNQLGASVGVEPFSFGGSLGASIATQLELSLGFRYAEATSTQLGFFGGQGKLTFKGDEIATLAADVYSDGYVDAQLKIDLHFPFESDDPVVRAGGEIGFWDEPNSGLWQAEGSVNLKLWIISAEVAGLVNNQYVAGCADVNGFGAQGRFRFSDGNIDGGLFGFSNCKDQLKQYQETPLVHHSGGFVGESALFRAAGLQAYAAAAPTAGAGDGFRLPGGTLGQELRISSGSGTPVVSISGPGGETFTTPVAPGGVVDSPGRYIAAIAPDTHQVLVLLRHPRGGEWHIAPVPGSPAINKLESSQDLPPATVSAHVSHRGQGRSWALAYRVGNFVPGTHVRFVERGRDSTHVLGTVSGARGTLRFVPQEALGRSRRVLAYLLGADGTPLHVLTVTHYSAPGAFRAGRPRGLRLRRQGSTALLTWAAVPGARVYRIKVRGSDGRVLTLTATPRRRGIVIAQVLPFQSFTATVSAAGGLNLLSGPAATVRLAALKAPKSHKPPKGRTKKHHH